MHCTGRFVSAYPAYASSCLSVNFADVFQLSCLTQNQAHSFSKCLSALRLVRALFADMITCLLSEVIYYSLVCKISPILRNIDHKYVWQFKIKLGNSYICSESKLQLQTDMLLIIYGTGCHSCERQKIAGLKPSYFYNNVDLIFTISNNAVQQEYCLELPSEFFQNASLKCRLKRQ